MNLVVGAGGLLGTEICRRLRGRQLPVRGLVRGDSPRTAELKKLGVELAIGDLRDAASLDAAMKGVTAVISSATAIIPRSKGDGIKAVDLEGHLRLIEAVKKTKIKRFVYICGITKPGPRTKGQLTDPGS